jgi:hypothetical protein
MLRGQKVSPPETDLPMAERFKGLEFTADFPTDETDEK